MNKRNFIILIGAVFIAIAGFIIFRLLTSKLPVTKISNTVLTKKMEAERSKRVEEIFQVASKTDSDLDGLTNIDEKKYGTSQTSSDTDKDGLLDKDEIIIYKTNPLKADTYGIGYDDGWGVRLGIILKNGIIDKNELSKIKK